MQIGTIKRSSLKQQLLKKLSKFDLRFSVGFKDSKNYKGFEVLATIQTKPKEKIRIRLLYALKIT